ncbi:MAG: excinuclease ABC subunit UvrA [Candidatus Gracilibacteria bacterium]|nr:excinuclease ABC subunit UvrA [Candidatus Gracilibacteria bacterium]
MSDFLEVKGARTHNLKNISVKIPKNKLTVITGLSGSGKSSLAFKTIYNIGQQKYLESLSSYARMFIGGMSEEALYDEISGLSPAISIDQKTTNRNPRSTVGTITEIYDFYKLLFLNIGDRKCIKCGSEIKKDTLGSIVEDISKYEIGTKFILKTQIFKSQKEIDLEILKKEVLKLGFIRYSIGTKIYTLNDTPSIEEINSNNIYLVIDRLIVKDFISEDNLDLKRLKDSLNLCFKIGEGFIFIDFYKDDKVLENKYSNIFVCSNCGHIPSNLDISSFSFNSPAGSCNDCHGLGEKPVFLEENIINPRLTIAEGAVKPWFGSVFYTELLKIVCKKNKIDINKPYGEYTKKQKNIVLFGTGDDVYQISSEFNMSGKLYNAKYKGVINILTEKYFSDESSDSKLNDYITNIDCPTCNGYRLNTESLSVYFKGKNIGELSNMSVDEAIYFFKNTILTQSEEKIAKNIYKNIVERLEFLSGVGLDYMTIARKSSTLSGGESQRIRLATQIGTKLEGILYVLDEPSIGLHPKDNDMLIENLKKLRDIGNTLIIVEHDEDIMMNADYIIDIGPGAGIHGGYIVSEGNLEHIINDPKSITGPFLKKGSIIKVDRKKRYFKNYLEIIGATENNLKNVDVKIPLENLVVVTGVSGSGKSSLVNDILANYLSNKLNGASRQVGTFKEIKGLENIDKAIVVDQSPIGKTPRSNPATYTGVFTSIRDLFAQTNESQVRGYAPGRFSFNTKDGRCSHCDGDGVKKIEMHFLPPVYVKCEYCEGKRFNKETLEVTFKGKTIADVLDMTVEEAYDFFKSQPKIFKILQVLNDVGLGYIKLGQSSTTLSGGESQRIKLAGELSKRSTSKTFYILDEPTTGLHFKDTEKLLKILHSLVDKGNSVLIIEHNMDVIINSDYIIDIGPNGGNKGGELVYAGDLEGIRKCIESHTGVAIEKFYKYKS